MTIKFWNFILTVSERFNNFELLQIANIDEVPLTVDVLSNRSVDIKGAKTMAVQTSGHEKTHFTVVPACCADGTKLPPMIMFKRKMFPKEN